MIFGIIPARQASERFPNKPVAKIKGRPMIWWVYRRVVECPYLDGVCLALPLNDVGIRVAAERYKIPYVMTYDDHVCGSDRCYEAARRLGIKSGIVINIQGDEPLVTHDHIRAVVGLFDDPKVNVGTLVYRADGAGDRNQVKVSFDSTGRVYNFTRADGATPAYFHAIGVIGFRLGFLSMFSRFGESESEKRDCVELWRCLDNGIPVYAGFGEPTIGVDVESDIGLVEEQL